ncbi:MAG: hypothetical protein ACQERU_05060 [Bacteroidota bacterium]
MNILISLLKKKYILQILFFSFLLIPLSATFAVFHNTYDFSIIEHIYSQVPVLLCSLFVFSVISPTIQNENNILKLFITVFVIQSLINIFSFISSDFLSIVQQFQYPELREHAQGNLNAGVFRGLSMAGTLYFGLSASFGLVYLLYTKYILDKQKICILDVLYGILLVIGNFFIARTGFVGLIFSLILLFLYAHPKGTTFKKIAAFTLTFILFVTILFIILPKNIKFLILENVLPFAFEFIYNYKYTGSIETSSTNHLIDMLSIPMDLKTFVFGDGWFTDPSGAYYMHTDSGYFRHILFGGIIYLFYYIFYQSRFFVVKNLKLTPKNKTQNIKRFSYVVFGLLIIFHIKGLTIGFNRITLIILFIYYLFLNINISKNIKAHA